MFGSLFSPNFKRAMHTNIIKDSIAPTYIGINMGINILLKKLAAILK